MNFRLKNKLCIILVSLLIISSCQDREKQIDTDVSIVKLKVSYVGFYISTISKITCEDFSSAFSKSIKTIIVDDNEFNKKFNYELLNLKHIGIDPDVNSQPDVRAIIEVNYSDETKEKICFGLHSLTMNGQSYQSENLRNLLIDKLQYKLIY